MPFRRAMPTSADIAVTARTKVPAVQCAVEHLSSNVGTGVRKSGDSPTEITARMPQLDGLRCFAALLVVAQHATSTKLHGLGLHGFGIYGVWLFFVLSGFLITGNLIKARNDAPRRPGAVMRTFYARRFLRIFPLYYAVVAVGVLVGIGVSFRQDTWWHLAYLSNWMMAARGTWADVAAPLWSLAVEEQFYLLWPALILFVPRAVLPAAFLATVAVGIISRVILAVVTPDALLAVRIVTPLTASLDPLAIGALLAWGRSSGGAQSLVSRDLIGRLFRVGLVLFGIVLVLSLIWRLDPDVRWTTRALGVIETTAASLISLWLVDRAADGFPRGSLAARILEMAPVRYIGTISYGVYLVHSQVLWAIERVPHISTLKSLGRLGELAHFGVVLAATIGVASAAWFGFERRANALKRHVRYPRTMRSPAEYPVSSMTQHAGIAP